LLTRYSPTKPLNRLVAITDLALGNVCIPKRVGGWELIKVGVSVPAEDGLSAREIMQLATEAESLGYDSVLVGEAAGLEPFSVLGMIASVTRRVRIGSGIVSIYSRSPALTAMGFGTLDSCVPGRVIAGVGVSSPLMVSRWHNVPFDAPLGRAREFVVALREVLRGDRVDLDGRYYRLEGFRLDFPTPNKIPIMLAAMNPRMLSVAGAVADAVYLAWTPPDAVPAKIEFVRTGAEEAHRDPSELEIVALLWSYVGPDKKMILERCRRFVLQYAMQSSHRISFTGTWANIDEADQAWHAGDRKAALALCDDAVVDQMCALGDADTVAGRIMDFEKAGVNTVIVLPIGRSRGDVEGSTMTLKSLAAVLQ
jgi:alkanesulfonate monooxygenase SsuD/methylene tetrahydromethanopterin reductase-like flavin-dependent oxidoreductase (luciferase family)